MEFDSGAMNYNRVPHNLDGRKKITSNRTSEELRNPQVLADVINRAMDTHQINKSAIDYLIGYGKGKQSILTKKKEIRPEINNTTVINHAQMVTRNVVGYFLGSPIQYISGGDGGNQELIDELNKDVQYEDKSSVDREIGEYQSICGTAFRIIYRDEDVDSQDEVPFEDRSLNPSTTFVVYENSVSEKPLLAVTYYPTYDDSDASVSAKFFVYTNFGRFVINANENGEIQAKDIGELEEYDVGGVPIIEYPNNMWRLGDWELCIGLMDAINTLQSGRMDDIDQVVQSLLVFINADIDSEVYDEMRKEGVVMLKNTTNNKTEIDSITNTLDQSGMNMFSMELEDLLYALLGIPNRNNRSGGGGDTGQAVELRDGWADLEIIARNKELTFKKAEKRTLKIILSIFNLNKTEKLNLRDIDIKFSRNKSNNLLVKTQSYQTLLSTKTLSPADCLTIVDLVSDVNEYISRGETFWGDEFANKGQEGKVAEGISMDGGFKPPTTDSDEPKLLKNKPKPE